MKISLGDLNVMLDTLLGSTSIVDGGKLFKYTADTRKGVSKKLIEKMSEVDLDIEIKSE